MSEQKKVMQASVHIQRIFESALCSILSVQIPRNLLATFKKKCDAEGVSMASIIKIAIKNYLAN